jgi:hypothetical protein
MDIIDMAIHPIICQKSDFHGKSFFQNSPKKTFTNTRKKIEAKLCKPFKDILVREVVSGALQK